jgi:hypothetical protein
MSDLLRLYGADELGSDGYPPIWHLEIKHLIRAQAEHRCVRCGHPYRNGEHGNGEWSACDARCTHGGPIRQIVGESVFHWSDTEDALWRDLTGCDARWRILTVHHLDNDKANCCWWNLAALCQRCHLQIQGKVLMARIWPWEHSQWFQPYVAGYYAHAYLGEDLERDDVMARLDELLGLERVA